jgi:hypothetical protein
MQLYDPNPQDDIRLKSRTRKHRRVFSQHTDPNWAFTPKDRSPSRRASRKSRNRPVSLEAQFDRAVGREPTGCAINSDLRFVNQCLH